MFPSYDDPLLEEAGLVRQREAEDDATARRRADDDRGRYDWFRDRIMFPIRGVAGEVIGFGGRVLDDSKPKYINSPETPVFSKGRELYGLFEARQALRDKGYALVVEGYMDVVALAQIGLRQRRGHAGHGLHGRARAEAVPLHRLGGLQLRRRRRRPPRRRRARWRPRCRTPPTCAACASSSCRPSTTPTATCANSARRPSRPAVAAGRAAVAPALEQAAEGADLDTAEGRARMLAQARPLWSALPDGALKRQLLPRTGTQRAARNRPTWRRCGARAASARGAAVARTPAALRHPPTAAHRRAAGRRAPAASADLALRLLLRHADWWERLAADDHELLHELGGTHGAVVPGSSSSSPNTGR